MKINNKNDVIKWLKRLKDDHPLSVGVCRVNGKVPSDGNVSVYTDQVIKNRYQGMIDFLESDEVTSEPQEDEPHCDCQYCGKRITIGESFQYETSGYTTYCDNTECTEGVATVGSLLEPCWFGEEENNA